MVCSMGRFGRHGTPLRYYVALEPGSFTSTTGVLVGIEEDEATCPEFYLMAGGGSCLPPALGEMRV